MERVDQIEAVVPASQPPSPDAVAAGGVAAVSAGGCAHAASAHARSPGMMRPLVRVPPCTFEHAPLRLSRVYYVNRKRPANIIRAGSERKDGLVTRLAVIPLVVIMAVALITTKWPMLVNDGFWTMAHEARTDWSMTLGALFLLVAGAGPWSVDAWFSSRR